MTIFTLKSLRCIFNLCTNLGLLLATLPNSFWLDESAIYQPPPLAPINDYR